MITALTAWIFLGATAQEPKPVSLLNGKDLTGWHMDVPDLDNKPDGGKPFIVRDGMLVSLGNPMGHLITDASYENYRLTLEWRWSKGPGNSGLIVHISKPRHIRNFLPKGIEAQLMSGNAGDFHLFDEQLFKPGSTTERAGKNFTDNSERPVGEWNTMVAECKADTIKVWVNGTLVNEGVGSSVTKGQIGLQSEGAEIEFRKLELVKL
jgi:hypothetical protein